MGRAGVRTVFADSSQPERFAELLRTELAAAGGSSSCTRSPGVRVPDRRERTRSPAMSSATCRCPTGPRTPRTAPTSTSPRLRGGRGGRTGRGLQDWGRRPWLAGWLRRAFFFRRRFEDMGCLLRKTSARCASVSAGIRGCRPSTIPRPAGRCHSTRCGPRGPPGVQGPRRRRPRPREIVDREEPYGMPRTSSIISSGTSTGPAAVEAIAPRRHRVRAPGPQERPEGRGRQQPEGDRLRQERVQTRTRAHQGEGAHQVGPPLRERRGGVTAAGAAGHRHGPQPQVVQERRQPARLPRHVVRRRGRGLAAARQVDAQDVTAGGQRRHHRAPGPGAPLRHESARRGTLARHVRGPRRPAHGAAPPDVAGPAGPAGPGEASAVRRAGRRAPGACSGRRPG